MRKVIAGLMIVAMAFVAGCGTTHEEAQVTKRDADAQVKIHETLQKKQPVPEIDGAAAREAISRHLERWQNSDVVSYVTLFADTGQPLGYYPAQGKVASTCQMLTSPVQRRNSDRPAMALDGTYYGDNVDCGIFFFTAESDAYVEWNGNYLVTDQPLPIDVQPLEVSNQ